MKKETIKINNIKNFKTGVMRKLCDCASNYVCDIKFIFSDGNSANVKSFLNLNSSIININSKHPTIDIMCSGWDDDETALNQIIHILKVEEII